MSDLRISELPPLSPVPSGEIPISQMHGAARVTCKATVQELVQSVAPRAHSHTPADIGLGNVDNTSDANKPVSGPTATAIANALQTHVNATNPHPQYATTAQVTQIVTAQAGGLAPVQSVNGKQGAVNITKADIGLGNVANLAPADMPVSTAVAAALGGKLDTAALAPALAGKIDSADARFAGIQRRKAQAIAGGTGARVLNPNTAAVMVDAGTSGIGGRTYTIAPVTADANDLVWFDYVFAHNSQPFLFSGVRTIATGAIADQTTLPMPPGSELVVLRFFRMPSGGFLAGNWIVSRIA